MPFYAILGMFYLLLSPSYDEITLLLYDKIVEVLCYLKNQYPIYLLLV